MKSILVLLTISALFALILYGLFFEPKQEKVAFSPPIGKSRSINSTMEIRGLHQKHYEGSRLLWSLKAKRAVMERAKIGFFRIAIYSSIKLEDVKVSIFLKAKDPVLAYQIFLNALKKLNSKRNITGISVHGFDLAIFQNKILVGHIAAENVYINPMKGSVILESTVRLSSNLGRKRTLFCDKAFWHGGAILVKGSYVLREESGRNMHGKGLQTDPFLLHPVPTHTDKETMADTNLEKLQSATIQIEFHGQKGWIQPISSKYRVYAKTAT